MEITTVSVTIVITVQNNELNDIDNDLICESVDNCPGIYNPLQIDTDLNGRGDACRKLLYR